MERLMPLQDLTPYLGQRCQVMLDCAVCGRTHTHEGTLAISRRPGEFELGGHTFDLSQIRALHPTLEQRSDAIILSGRAVSLLWQAALLLAAFSLLHAFMT
jgi:hypothetical protein